MKKIGLVFGWLGLSTGVAASTMLGLNIVIWGVLAASLGSVLGFLGFALIALALHPKPTKADRVSDDEFEELDIKVYRSLAKTA